jgi:hypothetical protein
MAMLIWRAGGAPPAGPGNWTSVLVAIRFHSVTSLVCAATTAVNAANPDNSSTCHVPPLRWQSKLALVGLLACGNRPDADGSSSNHPTAVIEAEGVLGDAAVLDPELVQTVVPLLEVAGRGPDQRQHEAAWQHEDDLAEPLVVLGRRGHLLVEDGRCVQLGGSRRRRIRVDDDQGREGESVPPDMRNTGNLPTPTIWLCQPCRASFTSRGGPALRPRA